MKCTTYFLIVIVKSLIYLGIWIFLGTWISCSSTPSVSPELFKDLVTFDIDNLKPQILKKRPEVTPSWIASPPRSQDSFTYFMGTGTGPSEEEAKANAMTDVRSIISNFISVEVEVESKSEMVSTTSSSGSESETKTEESFEHRIYTFSQSELQDIKPSEEYMEELVQSIFTPNIRFFKYYVLVQVNAAVIQMERVKKQMESLRKRTSRIFLILPFLNVSGDPSQQSWSTSLVENLSFQLSTYPKVYIPPMEQIQSILTDPSNINAMKSQVQQTFQPDYILYGSFQVIEKKILIQVVLESILNDDKITGQFEITPETFLNQINQITQWIATQIGVADNREGGKDFAKESATENNDASNDASKEASSEMSEEIAKAEDTSGTVSNAQKMEWLQQSYDLYVRHKSEEALEVCGKILESDPLFFPAYYRMGRLYAQLGKYGDEQSYNRYLMAAILEIYETSFLSMTIWLNQEINKPDAFSQTPKTHARLWLEYIQLFVDRLIHIVKINQSIQYAYPQMVWVLAQNDFAQMDAIYSNFNGMYQNTWYSELVPIQQSIETLLKDSSLSHIDLWHQISLLMMNLSSNLDRYAVQRINSSDLVEARHYSPSDAVEILTQGWIRYVFMEENFQEAYSCKFLLSIGENLIQSGNASLAQLLTFNALWTSLKSENIQQIVQSRLDLAHIDYRLGQSGTAMEHMNQALVLLSSLNQRYSLMEASSLAGQIYFRQGKIAHAYRFLEQGYQLARQMNHEDSLASLANNLGILYSNNGRYLDAQYYFQKARVMFEQSDQVQGKLSALNNLSLLYRWLGNSTDADAMMEGLETYLKKNELKPKEAQLNNLIGIQALFSKEPQDRYQIQTFFQKALELFNQTNDAYGSTVMQNQMAVNSFLHQDFDAAVETFYYVVKAFEGMQANYAYEAAHLNLRTTLLFRLPEVVKRISNARETVKEMMPSMGASQAKEEAPSEIIEIPKLIPTFDAYGMLHVMITPDLISKIENPGAFPESIFDSMIQRFKENKNLLGLAITHHNWAALHYFKGDGNMAYHHFQEALRYFSQCGYLWGIAHCYEWIGNLLWYSERKKNRSQSDSKNETYFRYAYQLYQIVNDRQSINRLKHMTTA